MAYNYESHPSPNFTANTDAQQVYGRPREFDAIAIHWWGDPAQNPTFEGVVAHLCDPTVQVAAHYVATGTGRRVAQLVDENNIAWATNSANPYTIAIECDPRCRDQDYDVVAELIANIWKRRGGLPLVPHNKFVQTICPGNYDLGRLASLAMTKLKGGNMKPTPEDVSYVIQSAFGRPARQDELDTYAVKDTASWPALTKAIFESNEYLGKLDAAKLAEVERYLREEMWPKLGQLQDAIKNAGQSQLGAVVADLKAIKTKLGIGQ